MKYYRIKKGKKKPFGILPKGARLFALIPDISEYRKVMFTESCKYLTKVGEKWKWHSLFGYKYVEVKGGNHSISLVWRYNQVKRTFEIAACENMNGSKVYQIISEGEPNSVIHVGLNVCRNETTAFGNKGCSCSKFPPKFICRMMTGIGIEYDGDNGAPNDMWICIADESEYMTDETI